jgi:hypothetical protein
LKKYIYFNTYLRILNFGSKLNLHKKAGLLSFFINIISVTSSLTMLELLICNETCQVTKLFMCITHGNYIWLKAHYAGPKWVVGNLHQIPNLVCLKSQKNFKWCWGVKAWLEYQKESSPFISNGPPHLKHVVVT